jgi:hypothetical protein
MAFNKKGTPADTISVLKEDGKVVSFCSGCSCMTNDSMDKKAFREGKAPCAKCGKCGHPRS